MDNLSGSFLRVLNNKSEHMKNMKQERYTGFFELTPTERWFLDEVNTAAKKLTLRFDNLNFKIGVGIIYSISSKNKIIS